MTRDEPNQAAGERLVDIPFPLQEKSILRRSPLCFSENCPVL